MATELRERFPDHVEITLFTPPEETRTGADWYWRFEKGGEAIHARVQAKPVQRTEFDQADDLGHVDVDLPQLRQLVEAAQAVQGELSGLQAWVATYMRFPANPPCGHTDLQECSRHRHGHHAHCVEERPSLWIAQARDILEVGSSRMAGRAVVEHSLRLDCMLPCIDGPGAVPGPATKGFTLRSDLRSFQDCVAAIDADARMRKELEGALRIAI